jgi:hypothetical protein
MDYLLALLIGGIALVGYSVYLVVKILKRKEDIRQSWRGILAMALIGAVSIGAAVIIRWVDNPKPDAVKQNQNRAMALAFNDFKNAYNQNAQLFATNSINWKTETGEKADIAKYSENGCATTIFLTKETIPHVTGIVFVFADSDDQAANFEYLKMMYALILTVDTSITNESVSNEVSTLLANLDEELVSPSGVEYKMQTVGGNIILWITLP